MNGSMMPGTAYGVLDLQGSSHLHDQQHHQVSVAHPSFHHAFPAPMNHMHDSDQQPGHPIIGKASASEEDEPSFGTEDGVDPHNETGKGKKVSPWHRVKWTGGMVKLLITAVSYISEDFSDCSVGAKRKLALLQRKGKWKLVSKVMAERGCFVSPQQCEDKFNDLNKRYKRLNEILGRGTSCKVVESPALLDLMDHITDKAKDDVKKILSSKHLFYEEMCSYHNGNRLHLPPDPALQRSLQLALMNGEEFDTMKAVHEDLDEDDEGIESDDMEDDADENEALHGDLGGLCFLKRMKHGVDHGVFGSGKSLVPQEGNMSSRLPRGISVDMNQVSSDASKAFWSQKQWISSRSLELEQQRLQIEADMLEIEKQQFKWQRFSRKKDRDLEKLRLENERMKHENEHLSLELKRKELEIEHNQMSK